MGNGIRVPPTIEVGNTQYAFVRLEDRPIIVLNITRAKTLFPTITRRHRSLRHAHVRRDERVLVGSINLSGIDGAAVFGYEPQD